MLFDPDEEPELFAAAGFAAGGLTFGIGIEAFTGGYADCLVFATDIAVFCVVFFAMIISPDRKSS